LFLKINPGAEECNLHKITVNNLAYA